MKLLMNIHQRLLWITASASLLAAVGCSNLPGTASSNNTAMYAKSDQSLESLLAYPHQGWDGGGGGQDSGPAGPAGSVGSSGGHSNGR